MISQATPKKTMAMIYADLDQSSIGTSSKINYTINEKPILHHTIDILHQAKKLDEIFVCCPQGQLETLSKNLKSYDIHIKGIEHAIPKHRIIKKRKWALSSWRGGIGDATCFDEQPVTAEIYNMMLKLDAYSAVPIAAEAICLDPVLLDKLIDHHFEYEEEMRFTFSHTAPGLTSCIYRMDLLSELIEANVTICDLLNYNPDAARADFINSNCICPTNQEINFSQFRYLADTQRSIELLEQIVTKPEQIAEKTTTTNSAENTVTNLKTIEHQKFHFPQEIEIEITTDQTLRIQGYPHAEMANQRKQMDLNLFTKIMKDCTAYDDICLTFGGFGEPLAHPQLLEMVKIAKDNGIFGINIITDGLLLKNSLADDLIHSDVDVISVYIDTHSPELYKELKGQDSYDQLLDQIYPFLEASHNHNGPLLIPVMVKSHDTYGDMDDFFAHWVRKCGHALIEGFNDFSGQIKDKAIMNMSPPNRESCRKLSRVMSILSDGNVTTCMQDFSGKSIVGNAANQSLKEIWQGGPLDELRQSHKQCNFNTNELCVNCKEWHR